MGAGASQQGRAWSGRREDRTDRSVGNRCEGIPGRRSGVAARQDLCAKGGTARLHTEGKWETEAVGNTDGTRPRGADGDPVNPGADLRGGFRRLLLWVPSWALGPPGA